jgi:hypothetical protein
MIAFVVATVEGLAGLGLYVAEQRQPGQVLELFLGNHFASIPPGHIQDYREHSYDAQLGWDYPPNTEFVNTSSIGRRYVASFAADGSRRHGSSARPPVIAAYGDSFTAGVDVNDDETWPYVLEQILDRGVRNFGTGAYGTDQAVLKFEGHVRAGIVASVTILGIHEENIHRIVNTFRPFYIRETGIELGFKPRYRCDEQNVLHLEPNPLAPFEDDPETLQRLAAQAAARDIYARHMLAFSLPFLPKASQALGDLVRYRLHQASWLDPGTLNFWADPRIAHLMGCIVEHFGTLAKRSGSTPVLVFIPKNGEPLSAGSAPPDYLGFIEQLQERQPGLRIVDIAREQFDAERFLNVRYSGHPSPYGNRVIAAAVARAIRPVLH